MDLQVFILDTAYRQIQNEVNRHPREETGGIMVGFRTSDALIVTEATGPGPAAIHHPNAIQFDEAYCVKKARQLQRRAKHLSYVGDWHSHPFTKLTPSKVDKRSFSLKSMSHYRTPTPIMIIAGSVPLVPLQAFVLFHKIKRQHPTLIDLTMVNRLKKQALLEKRPI